MTVTQFNALPLEARAQCLWEHGRFLTNRRGMYFMCNLYAVASFFVEVYYHPPTHSVAEVTGFEKTDRLSAYLEEVSLGELL